MIKTDSIMKRLLVLLIPLLVGLVSCSDQLNTNEGDGETGEMVEPVYSQDTFENESAIMLKDVPGIEILAKAVLVENGLIEDKTGNGSKYYFDDVAMIVNSKEMLKDVVVPSNTSGEEDVHYKWPEIDFEKYSLVIGHFLLVTMLSMVFLLPNNIS